MAAWRNGSASDLRSEGWEFESLCGQVSAIAGQLMVLGFRGPQPPPENVIREWYKNPKEIAFLNPSQCDQSGPWPGEGFDWK